jgi:hypothetical protein
LTVFNRLLQCNLGRWRRAHDLQTIREGDVALATVAEPYRVPDVPNWIGDLDGLTAVTWTLTLDAFGALLDRGSGYVAVEWAGIAVVAVYVSPNSGLAAFGDFLDDVGECVKRCFPRQVLVLRDFNAHSMQWGYSATNTRGKWLTDWAAGLGLLLVNKGTASTCVAWRGASVVDITWDTSDLYPRIRDWRVAEGVGTLSDHLYTFMEVDSEDVDEDNNQVAEGGASRSCPSQPPRWRLKERDREM